MPAGNGSNTSGILNGLGMAVSPDSGGAPIRNTLPANPGGSPAPNLKLPGNDCAATSPNYQTKGVGKAAQIPDAAKRPLQVAQAVAGGHIPGVLIPKDAPKIDAGPVTQKQILGMGVNFYKPHDKDIASVMFNPKIVTVPTLQKVDKAGKLGTMFPSMTKFLNGGATDKGMSNAPTEESPNFTGTNPPGHDTPNISDMNLTGSPPPHAPISVPILPKPSMSGDAQKQLLNSRLKAASGQGPNTAPGSLRPNSIVNGLYAQTT